MLGAHESWTCDSCPICIYTWRTYVCLCVHTLCVASVDFAFPWDWLRSCGQPQSKVSSQMLGDCIRTLDAQIFSLISLVFCCFWLCGWRGTLRSVLDSAFQLQAKGERLKRPALARTTFPPLSLTPPSNAFWRCWPWFLPREMLPWLVLRWLHSIGGAEQLLRAAGSSCSRSGRVALEGRNNLWERLGAVAGAVARGRRSRV